MDFAFQYIIDNGGAALSDTLQLKLATEELPDFGAANSLTLL